ncbi:uncharacterized protein LOC143259626 isoform X2 [Megalopta genalis]|uniref:uncharacterized protein LOC143259626 isoform X2 n=1 Tax=Megalopta genalis TaxID=115081 RepID=UPI003FD0D93F
MVPRCSRTTIRISRTYRLRCRYRDGRVPTKRTMFPLLTLCCIAIQVFTLTAVEKSLYNILMMLSYGIPMLLYFLRYVGFMLNFPIIKSLYENIVQDYNTLKNPIEAEMFMKQVQETKRVVFTLTALSGGVVLFVFATLLVPTLLRSHLQIHYLKIFGFFYNETSVQTDLVCCHLVLVSTIGIIALAGTEATLAVSSFYLCGLFEIASYRIQMAVKEMSESTALMVLNIRPAVTMHQRAIKLAADLARNMMNSYLVAIITVVVSFAVNLYRLYLAVMQLDEIDNVLVSLQFVLAHVIIMFSNNYSGQRLINTSIGIFQGTYNSLWYRIPPKSQKTLLFILMKSATEVRFNLSGLFTPCYEGFTSMMSSSFSYFTVLHSVQ